MLDSKPQPIFLKDYTAPEYLIQSVDLHFDLFEDHVIVRNQMHIRRNPDTALQTRALRLNGEDLQLQSVKINQVENSGYVVDEKFLVLANVSDEFDIEIITRIEPQKNLAFEGLYRSSGMFCTQCEAEGFRKITYYLDRPDVMSIFTVTIEGEQKAYPVLLSNGNPVERGLRAGGRHFVKWHDPFKKPCYLFALVAGDLGVLEDQFLTASGRKVKLQIFARHGLQPRCQHAMWSLKQSMRWDEEEFGREYDLDIFMIVAVDDFNMGAMENKGLNVFNSSYVLAQPQTATDDDYESILGVVGHEYFHNWTGNRITCRDWFQLSLKEGLTVYRDQEFSASQSSRAVKRIQDVVRLRTMQFAEDAGPMAHPVRPASYIEINNFYTVTIYEKGAEVIRMIRTILGAAGFRKGMDKYFELYDGQAVTTDDFVHAMEVATGVDLKQFRNWYDQAGTPGVQLTTDYSEDEKKLSLTFTQSSLPSPQQSVKKLFHIPIAVGLLGPDGQDLPLQILNDPNPVATTRVLHLHEPKQTFVFTGIAEKPVISALRDFSAPVRMAFVQSDRDLSFLMAHDSDAFNRWEAGQNLAVRAIQSAVAEIQAGKRPTVNSELMSAIGATLKKDGDAALKALILTLPAENYLAQLMMAPVDVDAIHLARETVAKAIAITYADDFLKIHERLNSQDSSKVGGAIVGMRHLKNLCLHYLTRTERAEFLALALKRLAGAQNMTDEFAALSSLNDHDCSERTQALRSFYLKWKDEPLVINKWFSLQAQATLPDTLNHLRALAADPVFDRNNPNKIYSLYYAFGIYNSVRFHQATGEAYRFLADQVLDVDSRNPQVAARLVSVFNQWRKFDLGRQALMKQELQRIVAHKGLSNNVFEIASKTLAGS
jgi:aminopeptidase N